ncbi:hypothetical protein [Streptomyces scopuliridis]|uniref:hypothetical protein n=1 Tax=Streptomyces scopuliridis TaxID=452529 RepID=UPI003413CC00
MMRHGDTTTVQQTHVLLEIVKAFAVCEHAMAVGDLTGPRRLDRLMEAHGILMAACGPGHHIPFDELMGRLTGERAGSLERLLPEWINAEELAGVRLLESDGVATEEGFDFRHEAQRVMRAAQKVGKFSGQVTKPKLDDEYSQESVFSAIKGPFYARHRRTLVENPTVPREGLAALNLPSRANDFYGPISQYGQYNGWWWPCPACHWPMKVTTDRSSGRIRGQVRCLYPWHEETGASYEFVVTTRRKSAPRVEPDVRVPGAIRAICPAVDRCCSARAGGQSRGGDGSARAAGMAIHRCARASRTGSASGRLSQPRRHPLDVASVAQRGSV